MAVLKIYDQEKKEVGELTLAPEVFEVAVKPEILNLVVRAQRASQRAGTHATRNRALIRGGGAKPWRQKGTGRARAGSMRSPLWRGGATVFGPQPRSYEFKVNKKVRRLALRMALSARVAEGNMTVLKGIELKEAKTKAFAQVLTSLGLKKALIVTADEDKVLSLSARNIPGVTLLQHDQLNVYDVLRYDQLIMLEDAAKSVEERLK
ncbi:50S ribosomal protein L4 [Desulfobaculum bizertense]|uniref:Large ribosomal subunit protein uL4 n=1 Tax=Desulfobaculum bizertense DSM 18034 TaxID=1121442 RepID=A0A1T4WFG8_9BACT|nr:50S ribosomal protein L4 [Desulfobaculum bizertense]UIJ36671.1 50S ribosomal protein L4 [Desulfobaculum bizertense]SKA76030.1 LSU ribosomal protein L4P [Desulfobaculum bizertense DSM 18034]